MSEKRLLTCEGRNMQNTSVNPNMKFTPPERIVVVPPQRFYRYSLYDELKLGENKYNEIKSALSKPSKTTKQLKRENVISNIFQLLFLTGIGCIGYKNRHLIMNQIKKIPYLNGKK